MAKHHKAKQRGNSSPKQTLRAPKHRRRPTPSLILLGTAAAGLSTALVLSQATDNTADNAKFLLANAAIGIGGRGDPTSANIPAKLQGQATFGYPYQGVNYPAGFDIDNSVAAGVPVLDQDVKFAAAPAQNNQKIVVVGYSEGALVAERERRNLATDATAPPSTQLSFVMIASANLPNGGIFARFPDLKIPFFVSSNGAAEPSPYATTFVTNEYDPYGDFPAYFNFLSLANTVAAIEYVHPDQYYDSVDYDPSTNTGSGVLIKTVGNETYVFVPADHLPLLAPVRQVFAAVGLTPFTEPVLDAIEPLLRLGVDMGYTDRQNLDPGTPTHFKFFTPPAKIAEAVAEIPGAIEQGVSNFVTGVEAIPGSLTPHATSPSPLLTPTKTPSIDAKLAPQDEQKLPLTDTPPKLPTGSSSPLANPPLCPPKGKPGPGLLKLAQGGNLATPGDSPKISVFKRTPKGEQPAKNTSSQGPGNAA